MHWLICKFVVCINVKSRFSQDMTQIENNHTARSNRAIDFNLFSHQKKATIPVYSIREISLNDIFCHQSLCDCVDKIVL